MNKESFFTPLVIASLSILFVTISLLLFLNPNSKKLLKRKFRIGGMIISLVGIMSFTQCIKPMCYDPVEEIPENTVSLFDAGKDTIQLDISSSNIISGMIDNCVGTDFLYSINLNDSIVQSGSIDAEDGLFDNYSERFNILVNDSLGPANYNLQLLAGSVIMRSYILAII